MSAIISACGTYRYLLGRGPLGERREMITRQGACLFIMLNPSTADAEKNDPTINKCIGYATRAGFRDMDVANLFAFRSTDPSRLADVPFDQAVGDENDAHIRRAAARSSMVVCAWGDGRGTKVARMIKARRKAVSDLLEGLQLHALGGAANFTKAGNPRHPLYLPLALKPEPFDLTQWGPA